MNDEEILGIEGKSSDIIVFTAAESSEHEICFSGTENSWFSTGPKIV